EIRRTLAQANPAAHLPDLAMSLNNLSVQQSGTGDRQAALGSITEAVELRRTPPAPGMVESAACHPHLPNGGVAWRSRRSSVRGRWAAGLAWVRVR
ncbi:hypothetical protein, partial [Streptomyces sp. SP18BB07]|uniref:hypothetical protein n=1 Tax=Streptomyces sp. SP18BB07 TaxID=3002522 RepID=UPI002E7F1B34|nr:hypothetical protein [Streptomyces sp. SP18BB07]